MIITNLHPIQSKLPPTPKIWSGVGPLSYFNSQKFMDNGKEIPGQEDFPGPEDFYPKE
jgi:hypothetical protein